MRTGGGKRSALTNILLAEVILRRQVPECGLLGVLNSHRLDTSQQHVLGNLAAQSVQPGHQHLIASATNSAFGGARSVLCLPELRLWSQDACNTRFREKRGLQSLRLGRGRRRERAAVGARESGGGTHTRRLDGAHDVLAQRRNRARVEVFVHFLLILPRTVWSQVPRRRAQGDSPVRARHRAHSGAVARTPAAGKSLPARCTYRIHLHRIGHPTSLLSRLLGLVCELSLW